MRILACLSAAVLAALLIATIVPRSDTASGLALVILLLNIMTLMAALTYNITGKDERLGQYYFYLYFLLFFLIPGYVHTSIGRFPFFSMVYEDRYIELAAACVLLFTLFFLAGYALTSNYSWRIHDGPRVRLGYGLALMYLGISIAVAFWFGIENYTISRGDLDLMSEQESSPVGLVLVTAPRVLSFVGLLTCLIRLKEQWSGPGVAISFLALAVFITVNSPVAIARFILFAYVIIAITVFTELTSRKKLALALAFFVGQLTIFPAVSLLSRGDINDLFSSSLWDFFVSNGDFDGFQSTINVVRYAELNGYRYGINLLSAVLFFVPREFWFGKSRGTGGEAAAFNGYDFINISAPLPSEFYVDFGVAGLIIGAAIFGSLLSRLDGKIRRYRRSRDRFALMRPATIVGYLFIVLRGSLVGVLGAVVLTYGLVWLSLKWSSLKQGLRMPIRSPNRFGRDYRSSPVNKALSD